MGTLRFTHCKNGENWSVPGFSAQPLCRAGGLGPLDQFDVNHDRDFVPYYYAAAVERPIPHQVEILAIDLAGR